jgi:hypothetical protein
MEKKFFFKKNLKSGPNPYGSALPFFIFQGIFPFPRFHF